MSSATGAGRATGDEVPCLDCMMPNGCQVWPVDPFCCDGWPDLTADPPPDPDVVKRAARAQIIASTRLMKMTGGRVGLCEELVRPCRDVCATEWQPGWNRFLPGYGQGDGILNPYLEGGRMFNACRGGCVEDCACSSVCRTTLHGPVHRVLEVKLDGEVLKDGVDFFVTEPPDNWLVRIGGCWPDCQEMTIGDDCPGSFSVRYLKGRDPEEDPDAINAVSALACELFKRACGKKCRLPGRVRSVQREGVSYEIYDAWPRWGTGLDEVDDWLALVNPLQRRAPAAVYTPDLPQARWYDRGALTGDVGCEPGPEPEGLAGRW